MRGGGPLRTTRGCCLRSLRSLRSVRRRWSAAGEVFVVSKSAELVSWQHAESAAFVRQPASASEVMVRERPSNRASLLEEV